LIVNSAESEVSPVAVGDFMKKRQKTTVSEEYAEELREEIGT